MEDTHPEEVLTPEQEAFEYQMYLEMKASPEWEILPKPERWYKKYNIPNQTISPLVDCLKYKNSLTSRVYGEPIVMTTSPVSKAEPLPIVGQPEEELTFKIYRKPYNGESLTFDDNLEDAILQPSLPSENLS